jgi:hypothetical protein
MSTPSFGSAAVGSGNGGGHEDSAGLSGQAQERALSAAEQARARAREELERRSSDLAVRADGTAEDLRGVAGHLRSQGKDGPARLAEQAAERVSNAGQYLQRSGGDVILHDVEALARRRPWLAIAGGAALGLTASRFLKASSSERYRTAGSTPGRPTTTYGGSGVASTGTRVSDPWAPPRLG